MVGKASDASAGTGLPTLVERRVYPLTQEVRQIKAIRSKSSYLPSSSYPLFKALT